MAPPTVPTERKKRRGTFRSDRSPAVASEVVAIERPDPSENPPPASLREAGQAEWDHALRTCVWIGSSDLTALRFLCEAIDRREELAKELTKVGSSLMLETSTGYAYANPAIAALEKTEDRITKWMSLLGMTPSDRSKLGVAEVKAKSVLDQLAQRRQAGRPGSARQSRSTPPSTETDETS